MGRCADVYKENKKCFTIRGIMGILGTAAFIVGLIIGVLWLTIAGLIIGGFFWVMFASLFKKKA